MLLSSYAGLVYEMRGANCLNLKRIWTHVIIEHLGWTINIYVLKSILISDGQIPPWVRIWSDMKIWLMISSATVVVITFSVAIFPRYYHFFTEHRTQTNELTVNVTKDHRQWRFYRAMLCIRGTSHGPVSVCLSVCPSVRPSVTSRCSTKTDKRRITQTTPHDSPGTLVFGCQRSPRNSTGVTPCGGAKYRLGGSKSATFDK